MNEPTQLKAHQTPISASVYRCSNNGFADGKLIMSFNKVMSFPSQRGDNHQVFSEKVKGKFQVVGRKGRGQGKDRCVLCAAWLGVKVRRCRISTCGFRTQVYPRLNTKQRTVEEVRLSYATHHVWPTMLSLWNSSLCAQFTVKGCWIMNWEHFSYFRHVSDKMDSGKSKSVTWCLLFGSSPEKAAPVDCSSQHWRG